jgi:hypothetical protein
MKKKDLSRSNVGLGIDGGEREGSDELGVVVLLV